MIWLQWQSQCQLQNIYCIIATWCSCMTCICQKVFPCLWIVVWLTSICWCQRYCCRRTMGRGWRCTGMFHFCGSLAAGLGCRKVWGPCGTSAQCASFESSSASSCHGRCATPPCWQCPPGAWGRWGCTDDQQEGHTRDCRRLSLSSLCARLLLPALPLVGSLCYSFISRPPIGGEAHVAKVDVTLAHCCSPVQLVPFVMKPLKKAGYVDQLILKRHQDPALT